MRFILSQVPVLKLKTQSQVSLSLQGAACLPDPHPDTPELLSPLSVIGVPRHVHSHTGRGNALFSRFPSPFVYKRGSFRNLDGKEF